MKRIHKSVILSLGLVALSPVTGACAAEAPVVSVAEGKLSGLTEDGVISYKGIPFAAPPVGELRWRAPQPAAHWDGVRKADAYAHDCMQKPFDGDAAPLGTPPAEDCLYANVWKPTGAKGKLPVLVWIYGGGFLNGGASPPTYSGAELAQKGVMVVSFNYRLGRFGFFAHPALAKAKDGNAVNYGFLDQIAALRWVQANIAAFGGDPEKVTIAGESAGGNSVNNLMTSPMARGLFDGAVVMSGGNGSSFAPVTMETANGIGESFAQSKGIAPGDADALAKLRALPAETIVDGLNLMALFNPSGEAPRFIMPFPDGKIAVDQRKAYEAGAFEHVPVMIGATSADIGGDTGSMVAGARKVAGVIGGQGVPVYEYRFSYVASSSDAPGAPHATDIPFFFDTQAIKYGAATTPRDNAMGAAMSDYLVNFVKRGDPNAKGLPAWQPYAKADGALMDFAPSGKAVFGADPLKAKIDATDM